MSNKIAIVSKWGREIIKGEVKMQGNKLYVGNLSYHVTDELLEELFANFGEVINVNVIEDRGFGFVEMSNQAEAERAKEELDGIGFEGRTIKVDKARPYKKIKKGHYRMY